MNTKYAYLLISIILLGLHTIDLSAKSSEKDCPVTVIDTNHSVDKFFNPTVYFTIKNNTSKTITNIEFRLFIYYVGGIPMSPESDDKNIRISCSGYETTEIVVRPQFRPQFERDLDFNSMRYYIKRIRFSDGSVWSNQ